MRGGRGLLLAVGVIDEQRRQIRERGVHPGARRRRLENRPVRARARNARRGAASRFSLTPRSAGERRDGRSAEHRVDLLRGLVGIRADDRRHPWP